MNGLHLISTSKAGVTIQFYALLLTALLEPRLKQACVATYEASQQRLQEPATETQIIPSLMVPPDTLASARGQIFLATVGEKLHRYWKISVHWLVHLRNLLAQPFDQRTICLLPCT